MRKVIKASSVAQEEALNRARKIKARASELFDLLEDAPEGFVDNNGLGILYDELLEVLPLLTYAINGKTIEF